MRKYSFIEKEILQTKDENNNCKNVKGLSNLCKNFVVYFNGKRLTEIKTEKVKFAKDIYDNKDLLKED